MKMALFRAREEGFDVFNALDILDNSMFLDELKFSMGDGYLHYYLFNWNINQRLSPSEIGVVLV